MQSPSSQGASAGSAPAGLRVVVAHADDLVARGLAALLAESGAVVVARVRDARGVLAAVSEHTPDVLVTSLELAAPERQNVVAAARQHWPHLAIVAVSDRDDDEGVLLALAAGASAHVRRSADAEQLVAATVQAAASPGAFLAADPLGGRRRDADPGPGLTPRESEVLRLAAEGLAVRGISERLFISQATTRSHLSGIYRKLGVSTRSQAVLRAERAGLLR